MTRFPTVILAFLACAACEPPAAPPLPQDSLEALVRDYLFLELSMGLHDEGHVDAYFGPEDIRARANDTQLALDEIAARAVELRATLQVRNSATATDIERARIDGLVRRLTALQTRVALASGEEMDFDAESLRLFAASAPHHDAAYFQEILDDIDQLIGGEGDLSARVNAFHMQFAIPEDRLAAVFDAAIAECRRRTLASIDLPANESFSVEFVTDKPWSGYNWYQGDARSLIQINTDLPIFIGRAVDLGCHEGYPGHHTFNALLEKNLVTGKGWLEFSIYPLFSPQSLIAEGSGNYGIDMAFPGEERASFEKDVLFPLAGLDTDDADRYFEMLELLAKLNYAGNEAARDYLNGEIDRDEAAQWLVDYSLSSPERARQRIDFFDTYRSYVINYNLGQDLVRRYVEAGDGTAADRWTRFARILSEPVTAADLH